LCPPRSHFPVSGRCLRVSASQSSTSDLNPPPLLSSGCLSPRSFTSTLRPHPHARVNAPLVRFRPLQRSTESGVRFTRRFHPPAPSVPRVSHPLDVLLRPKPYRAYFIPAALWGFPRTSAPRADLSIRQGRRARVSSPRPSPPPRRTRVRVLSRLAFRRVLPPHPFGALRETTTGAARS
jgi:hypothetical protein